MAHYERNNYQSLSNRAIDKFTELIVSRLEEAQASSWKKGWIGGNGVMGLPQNLSGRNYAGLNSLFLFIDTAKHHYSAPVYMTFLQKEKEGLLIRRGETAMPVVYWDMSIKDNTGKNISTEIYKLLSKEEQQQCEVHPFLRSFRVYNIDQTNMKEVNQAKYQSLVDKFQIHGQLDTQGMYQHPALDRMFEQQQWLCKIECNKPAPQAYYSPKDDTIVLPEKGQFKVSKDANGIYKDGMEYYSTALHEMTHSTGIETRLNRNMTGRFGDPKYAKEELVAELSAALTGYTMGFDRRIQDNNVAYVKNWLTALREEPKFIVSVMADVNKASNLILQKIDEQKMALGEKPILNYSQEMKEEYQKQEQQSNQGKNLLSTIENPQTLEKLGVQAGIFKLPSGAYVLRASVGGQDLEQKPIDNKTAVTYLQQRDVNRQGTMLADIVKDIYGDQLHLPKMPQRTTMGLKI